MTNPTTPGIAELLDDYRRMLIIFASNVNNDDAWDDEPKARILAHVAAIEAQRDEALKFIERAFVAYPNLDLDIANVTTSDSPDSPPAR